MATTTHRTPVGLSAVAMIDDLQLILKEQMESWQRAEFVYWWGERRSVEYVRPVGHVEQERATPDLQRPPCGYGTGAG